MLFRIDFLVFAPFFAIFISSIRSSGRLTHPMTHSTLTLCARMPEQSINKYVWQWGVTIQKTIADRFSASKIVSDGRSMSNEHANMMSLSHYTQTEGHSMFAACAEFSTSNKTKKKICSFELLFMIFVLNFFPLLFACRRLFSNCSITVQFIHMWKDREAIEKKHQNASVIPDQIKQNE